MCLFYLIFVFIRFIVDFSWREIFCLFNIFFYFVFFMEWKVGLVNGLEGFCKVCFLIFYLNEVVVVLVIENMFVELVFC